MSLTFALTVVITVFAGILAWWYLTNKSGMAEKLPGKKIEVNKTSLERLTDDRDPVKNLPPEDEKPNVKEEEVDDLLIKMSDLKSINSEDSADILDQHIKEEGFSNLQTYYKTSRLHLKEMENEMTQEEKEQEREAQRKQLEKIFELMERQKEKFGVNSLDDIQEQMKLYAQK